jgi:DNA helicase HerA-like ATPase
MLIRSDEIVIIIGRKGHGKTTLLKLLLKQLRRYAVFDILGVYREFGALVPTTEACTYDKTVYIPQTEAIDAEYEEFAAAVLRCGNRTIILDEAHWIYRPKGVGKNAQLVLRLGRHVAVGLWLATHRVLDLAKLVYQQADHLFLGQLLVYRDLEELRRIYGPVVEKAKELRPREFLYIDVKTMKTRKIVLPQVSQPVGSNRKEEEEDEL